MCQPGDFTLKEPEMSEPHIGPWKVEYLHGYDVTYRHVVQDTRYMFPLRHVKIFAKTHEQAFKAATLERTQYTVRAVHANLCDPDIRTTIKFYIKWKDDTKL